MMRKELFACVGAMAASGVLHGGGFVHAFLPVPVAICSFIVMGAMIGTRLGGADIRMLARLSLVGVGALLVGSTVGCLFAAAVAWALIEAQLTSWPPSGEGGVSRSTSRVIDSTNR